MAPYGDSVDVHVRQVLNAEEAAFLQSAIAGGPDRPQASLWFGNVSLSFAIMTDDGPTKAAVSLGYKIFRVGD